MSVGPPAPEVARAQLSGDENTRFREYEVNTCLEKIKNLNWPDANQLAIYKHSRVSELWAIVKQIQVVVRAVFQLGTAGLRV